METVANNEIKSHIEVNNVSVYCILCVCVCGGGWDVGVCGCGCGSRVCVGV